MLHSPLLLMHTSHHPTYVSQLLTMYIFFLVLRQTNEACIDYYYLAFWNLSIKIHFDSIPLYHSSSLSISLSHSVVHLLGLFFSFFSLFPAFHFPLFFFVCFHDAFNVVVSFFALFILSLVLSTPSFSSPPPLKLLILDYLFLGNQSQRELLQGT